MAKLTPISVANAKPGDTRREISDGGTGLWLVVQPSGKKGFAVRYRINGRPTKLTLKAGTLADARRQAATALHEVEQGRDPVAAKKQEKIAAELKDATTLRAVAELYLKREEAKPPGKRLRTIDQRRDTFERLVYPRLGGRPIADIKRSEVVALMDDVEEERGGRMADEVLSVLRIVFDWHALRSDDFKSPIVKGMTLTKPKDRMRDHKLSDAEVAAVWHAAQEMPGAFGPFVQFALLTATRRNEAARLRWGELSPDRKTWVIPAARYKSKRDHLVPLSPAAQALLAKLPPIAGCEFVFTNDGKRAVGGFSRGKAKLDEASGVTGWRLHDLRRVSRSLMSAADVDRDTAERCLGHRVGGILDQTYDKFEYREQKAIAFEKLAARIECIVNPPPPSEVADLGQARAHKARMSSARAAG
jgi:integrase